MTATSHQFSVGDRVTPINDSRVPAACRGRVYKVRKVNPRNLRCEAEDGGRGINFPAELLLPATDENVAAGKGAAAIGVPYVPREFFSVGEIVTLERAYRDYSTETPMVVTGGRAERVNVTPLGGDNDRYLRIAPSGLTRRDLGWLREQLAR